MRLFLNIILLLLGLLILKNSSKRYTSAINHLNIFSAVWSFVTLGAQIAYPDKINIETVVLYYFAWYFYLLGSSLLKHKKAINNSQNISFTKVKILILFLLFFCIIANMEIVSLVLKAGDIVAWGMLRKEKEYGDLESNLFITLFQRAYLIFIPLGIYLLKEKQISKYFLIALISVGLLFSILRFTRAPLLHIMMMITVSYVYIYRKKIPWKILVTTIVVMLLVFLIFDAVLSGENEYTGLDSVKLYLFGGQVAFQDFLEGRYIDNTKYDNNLFSLDFLNYILKRLDVIESYPSYVRIFTNSPDVTTNTYTYLDAYAHDFGIIGVLLGSFFFGLISDFVYKIYNKNSNIYALIFYGYICYFNAFIFANNELIRFTAILTATMLFICNFLTKERYTKPFKKYAEYLK